MRCRPAWTSAISECILKLDRNFKVLAIVGTGIGGWLLAYSGAPPATARLACGQHVTAATGHKLTVGEVSAMRVLGNAQSGQVHGVFIRSDELRYVVCEFENGRTKSVLVDGASWTGLERAAVASGPAARGATVIGVEAGDNF